MTNIDHMTADYTVDEALAEAVRELAARIRREGDLTSNLGQFARLYDIADDLEAALGQGKAS